MQSKHELVPAKDQFQSRSIEIQIFLKKLSRQILTSKFIIRWHNSTKRFVPNILIWTESSNFSSNLTVAAEWNTMDTLRHNRAWSLSDIPSWGSVMSPQIGMTFFNSFGFSLRIVSKSCKFEGKIWNYWKCGNFRKINCLLTGELRSSFRRTDTSCPRFGRMSR